MKKIIASAVGLMMVGGVATTASAAIENQFGGYWRTRFTIEDNMGFNDATSSREYVDTRTRLFYTAKFSDDFKFINRFEFNTGWGDMNGGDIGADGTGNWRVKHSYADFNLGANLNTKVGIQGGTIARGFIFADDFSGVTLTGKFGNVSVPFIWINALNEDTQTFNGAPVGDKDMNILALMAAVKVNDAMTFTPYFVYHDIANAELAGAAIEDTANWYLGVDGDMKFGSVGTWFTAIYNGGDVAGVDNAGYLGAVGVDAGLVHGQFFYSSGDDNRQGLADDENDAFVPAPGASYYWSEIMGYGIFDNRVSLGSPADKISNIWAGNVGVTVKPMDKLKVDFDVWYAARVEDNAFGDTELGWEFDGKLTYNIFDNLTAEAVLAYLIAGDATPGDDDVIEGGVQLSLKF